MAQTQDYNISSKALFKYITKEKKDVVSIYIYAILGGLVQLSIPLGIQAIVSYVMGATMVTSLYLLIGFVVLGTFLYGVFRIKVMQIIEKIQQKIFVEFSLAYAEKLPKIDLSYAKKYYLPELVNRFFDTQNLQKGLSKILLEIPTALIQITFGLLLLSFYHPWFLIFGSFVIIIVVLIFRLSMQSGIKSSIEESDHKYQVASWLEDIALAIKTFKINSKTDIHLEGTDDRVLKYLKSRTDHFKILMFQFKAIIAFNVVLTLVMLIIGTYLLLDQKLNIGAFVATEIVLITIMNAVEKIIKSLESYYDVITSLAKLNKVTDLKEEYNAEIAIDRPETGIRIDFKDVNFSFNDNKPILNDLNFTVPSNSLAVITGHQGDGKSLLLNMMAGFYEPAEGTILLDKVPYKNYNKSALRDSIGVYMEDMRIIKGTLKENVLFGRSNITTEEILELCEEIGLGNLSGLFSNGFYTELSETDTELSYSSRKKILLLRALLSKNRLLLLEDPIDGMPLFFRERFLAYLKKIKADTTIVIVSESKDIAELADIQLQLYNKTLRTN